MKRFIKRGLSFLLCLVLVFSLTGCTGKEEKRYQNYVKSLIAINYLGATKDYIKATGANEEDADALYNSNAELFAQKILDYYSINISDAPDMMPLYVELAKNIYSKVNYSVAPAYEKDGLYYVDVTIYPLNLFGQISSEITAYVEAFNTKVANGDYNNYTVGEYETEFSTGFLDILNNGCTNMTYGDPVVVTIQIVTDKDTYYISNSDFLKLDAAMIQAATELQSPSDAITD